MKNQLVDRLVLGDNSDIILKLGQEDTVSITQYDSSGPQTLVFDRETAGRVIAWLAEQMDVFI